MLNADLSKKVQEFKIAVNATNKELIIVRNELMAEKLKSSELRRALNIMNGQCTNFFNAYMLNLQKCIERTDLQITIPGDFQADPNIASTSGQSAPQNIPLSRPTKFPQPVDPNVPNILHTIIEDTGDTRFLVDDPIIASTPFVPTVNTNQNRLSQFLEEEEEDEVTTPTPRVSIPKRSLTAATRSSAATRPSRNRILDETSSEEEMEAVTFVQHSRNITRRQNITVDLSVEEEEDESRIDDTVVVANNHQDQENLNETVSNYLIKDVQINVEKCDVSISSIDTFKACFVPPEEAAPEPEPEPININTEAVKENINVNSRAVSIDSALSTTSHATTATTTSSLGTSLSTTSKVPRKRKAISEIPRRSTGRPKRKARMAFSTLAEAPLNRKMRRSK
jgi:hypothetical protein